MAFKDRLKEARLKNNLAQNELASRLGISPTTYNGYEAGRREPNFATLAKLINILHIDANFLLQDEFEYIDDISILPDEYLILNKYRNLDEHGKRVVDLVLDEEFRHIIK